MSKETQHMSRPQKRKMYKQFGIIEKKKRNTEEGRELYNRLREEGRDAHEKHVNIVNDSIGDQLQVKLDSVKKTWKEIGYNTAEIKLLEEAWVLTSIKDKETYRADKKEAKRLRREVNKLKAKRLNANNNS
jgi:DNA-binding MarR family transcriptional regulator